ncbi:DNA polymerase III subunits gamma and tau [Planctomycetes bacterium MalM25]|nr:DNA polymerase III subunits gamma and tau [Planctomycetes bacterium MalM25]
MSPATSREISMYFPNGFDEFCGNTAAIDALRRRLGDVSGAANLLITGPPGTGKSGMAKVFGRTLCCQSPDLTIGRACGGCGSCRLFDCRDSELYTDLWAPRGRSLAWWPIDCGNVSCRDLRLVRRHSSWEFDQVVVWLDEAHRLSGARRGQLLKKMEEDPNAFFVATTSEPDALPLNFRRRFAEEVETEWADASAITRWLADRCRQWGVAVDDPSTFALLARRSRGNVAFCQATVAAAAGLPERVLTATLVRSREAFFDAVEANV